MTAGAFRFDDAALAGVRRVQTYYVRNRPTIFLSLLVALFTFVACAQWFLVNIPAGHVGVMWYRLGGGTDTGTPHGEGLHLILPWDRMELYDARVQQISRDFEVLTQDGMVVTVNVAWQFRVKDVTAGLLHRFVGPAYVETLVVPAVGSYTRHVFSQYSTEDAYTLRRADVQEEIRRGIVDDLSRGIPRQQTQGAPWIVLESVLIRGMQFPPEVAAAINRKMEQYQLRQEYAYRLERERLESERKEVEADGIARFQRIVGAGISENYLRWRGIDATLALARSNNAKVVVIGNPRDGMPLILGGADRIATETGTAPQAERGHDDAPRLLPPMGEDPAALSLRPAITSTVEPSSESNRRRD